MAEHILENIDQLAVGDKVLQTVGDKNIIIYRLSDGYYATSSKCTHLFINLTKGKILDDKTIQCPAHRAQFDIRTGEVQKWANFPPGIQLLNAVRSEKCLTSYVITEREGNYYVQV